MKLLLALFGVLAGCCIHDLVARPAAMVAGLGIYDKCVNTSSGNGSGQNPDNENWYYSALGVRSAKSVPQTNQPVIIAIIDNGMRLGHADIAPFLFENAGDPANGFDDDANGYQDDVNGWDVADADADVNPPKDRLETFYHGTHMAGVVAEVLTACYGEKAPEYFKILPVKAVADRAELTYIKDGYRGIQYAVKMGADIILCAWGSNVIKDEERRIVQEVVDAGITLITSAGNFSNNLDYFPASLDGVIAVAALDSMLRKEEVSNFGQFVDLSAPGQQILGASSMNDTDRIARDGSSSAAALTAAAAGILSLHHPGISPLEMERLLNATAIPVDRHNPSYIGRLGAGTVSIGNIMDHIEQHPAEAGVSSHEKQKGFIPISRTKKAATTWAVAPYGPNQGLEFTLLSLEGKAGAGSFSFATPHHPPIHITLDDWQKRRKVTIDGPSATLQFTPNKTSRKLKALLFYEVVPIDSSVLYCRETAYLTALADTITDGSGTERYANKSACKWQITVPEGYRVSIDFTEFDTEAIHDNLFLFDGEYAIPEYAIARFSGPDIPPKVVSRTNSVLLWFVTNSHTTANGWKLMYEAVSGEQ